MVVGFNPGTIATWEIALIDAKGNGDTYDLQHWQTDTAVGRSMDSVPRKMLVVPESQITFVASGVLSCIQCQTLEEALAIL